MPIGGSLDRRDATARGVVAVARDAAAKLEFSLTVARIAIQGFGNVGEAAARLFAAQGARVVALQDHTGTLADKSGLDIRAVREAREAQGKLVVPVGSGEDFWAVPWDILVPAALEGQ